MVNSSASYEGDGNATQVQTSCKSTSSSDLPSGTQTTEVFEEKDYKGGSLYCSLPLDKILPLEEIQKTPEKAQEVFRIQSLKLPEKILKAQKEKMLKDAPKAPEKAQGAQKPAKPPKGRKLLCLYCERSFVSPNLRQKHVERVHSTNSATLQNSRRLSARRQNQVTATSCGFCDKLNDSEKTLKDLFLHLVNEHSNKYYACLPCEDRFASRSVLAEHNATKHQTQVFLKQDTSADSRVPSPQIEEAQPVKLTRSRLKHKNEEDSFEENKQTLIKKKTVKLKELKSKKLSVKSSRIALQRRESKRLQNLAKGPEKKKKRSKPVEKKQTSIVENSTKTTEKGAKSSATCVNPYPEFDSFYRVKKITDHSIDNLKISSLTFDDVFDKAFFNRIKCNIEENLLHHIDGKLFENEESENRISNFEKISMSQENQTSSTENYGCDISLNAVTPVASLSLNSQFGEDFESQIEYGSKPSKKKAQIRKDEVHYKYFTRRKFQASILEHKENRDLSRLDMWTQLVIKKRQQKMLDQKKTAKEMLEYTTGNEYRSKMKREELNRILDRRGPFEDLKEEASKKAAQDKLSSSHKTDLNHESYVEVREVLYEILNKVFESCEKNTAQVVKREDLREIPSYLNLRSASLPSDEIDESDRITLICSSQETENFELPTNQIRGKDEVIELSGEWARCRMYICAACGAKLPNMKYLMEHKNVYHQNVWVQHYEFVGNQSELYRHLSIPCLGKIGAVEVSVPCKTWKRSEARLCTKCGKQCNSLGELHRHVLECGGDWTWMLARKKCKYRPFGAKSRRKRRGLVHRVHVKRKTEPKEKKNYKKTFEGPRQRPSDAETIQRMLANLPAKRSTRKLISLQDGIYRARKKKIETQVNKTKIKCGKVIYKSRNIKENPEKTINTNTTTATTRRTLRNIGKVLSSKIIDSNSSLAVRRKLRAINERRRTKQLQEANVEEIDAEIEEVKKPESVQKETEEVAKRTSPRSLKKMSMKKILTGKVNIKTFFPVKKSKNNITEPSKKDENKTARSKRRSKETENTVEGLTPDNAKGKKTEPKKTKNECLGKVASKTSTPKKKKTVAEPEKLAETEILEENNRKRKVRQHFKLAMDKVKKLKIDTEVSQKKQAVADSFLGRNKQNDKLDPKVVLTPHSFQEKVSVNPQPQEETVINPEEITVIKPQIELVISTEKITTQEKLVENQKILSENLVINPQEKNAINLLAQEIPHENTIISSEKTHSQPEKIIITSSTAETEENTADISETVPIVMKFNEIEEDHQIPETIFKLESNNEKSLQAKGELNFDSKPSEKEKTQPITIETSVKQKTPPLVSPNLKGKIRKPSRGLNDCIAMLTNKLQQKTKDDSTDGALDLSSSAVVKPRSDCILKIPTFKSQQVSALDLSMKSKPKFEDIQCFLQNKPVNIFYKEKLLKDSKPRKFSRKLDPLDQTIEDVVVNRILQIPKFYNSWSSVDETIQNVIDNHNKIQKYSWSTVDDIIEFVVASNTNKDFDYQNPTVKLGNESKITFTEDHSIFEPKVIITESDEQICSVNKLELIEDIICQKRAEVLNRPKRGRPKKGNDERKAEDMKAVVNESKEAVEAQDDGVQSDVPEVELTNKEVEQIGEEVEQICEKAEQNKEQMEQANEGVKQANEEVELANETVEQVDVPITLDSLGITEEPVVYLQECSEKCSDSEDEIPLATLITGVKVTHDGSNSKVDFEKMTAVETSPLQRIESSALESTITNSELPENNTLDINLENPTNLPENIPEILNPTEEISKSDEPSYEKSSETIEDVPETVVTNGREVLNECSEEISEQKKEEVSINSDQRPDITFNSSIPLEDSSAVFKAPMQKKTKRKSKRMKGSEKTKAFYKNEKPTTENIVEPTNDERSQDVQVVTETIIEENVEIVPVLNPSIETTGSTEETFVPNDNSEPLTVSTTEESNSESSDVPDSILEINKKKSKRKTYAKKKGTSKLNLNSTEITGNNSDSADNIQSNLKSTEITENNSDFSDNMQSSNDDLITSSKDIFEPSRISNFNIRDLSVSLSKDKFIDSLKQGEFLCINQDENDGKSPMFLKICQSSDVSELSDSSKSSDFSENRRVRRHSLRFSKCDEFSGSENSVDSLSNEKGKGMRKNSRTSLTDSFSLETDRRKSPRLKLSIEDSVDKVSTRNNKKGSDGLENSQVGEIHLEFLEKAEKMNSVTYTEENKKITRSYSRNNSCSDVSESSQLEVLIGEEKRRKSVRISGKINFPSNFEESSFNISESDTSVVAQSELIKELEIQPIPPKIDTCNQDFAIDASEEKKSEYETDKIESGDLGKKELSVITPLSLEKKKIYKGKKKKKKPASTLSRSETLNGVPEQIEHIKQSLDTEKSNPEKFFDKKIHVKIPVHLKKRIKFRKQKKKIYEKNRNETSKPNEDISESQSNLEKDVMEASQTSQESIPDRELPTIEPAIENSLCALLDANTEIEPSKRRKFKNNSKSSEEMFSADIDEFLNIRKPRSTRNNKISYDETEDNDTDDKNEDEEDAPNPKEVETNSTVPSENLPELVEKTEEQDLDETPSLKESWDKSPLSPDQSENTENVAKNNFPENSTEEEVDVSRKEPPIKLIINTQKTRRKSKSFKKGNLKGELFKDFALVIKKPKRSTHVIAYSNSEVFIKDLKNTDLNFLEEEPKHNGDIDVSMEEMDMEIDDIPFTSNIIERNDLNVVSNIQNSNSEDDVKVQKKSKTKQLCKRKFKGSKNRRIHKTRVKKLDQILKENNKINEISYQTESPAIADESTNISEKIGAEDIETKNDDKEAPLDLLITENEETEVIPNPEETEDRPSIDHNDDNNPPEPVALDDKLQKDIDNIYNFDETDDLDEPLEIPLKRFSRKQHVQRFELGTTVDEEKKLTETEDVDPVVPAKPTVKKKANKPRDETSFLEDLDQTKKRNKPRDELSLLETTESFSRKSVRSAKVKALESIHDEALAELTEDDEQDRDSKKSKKSQKVTAIVNDFEFSKKILGDEKSPSFADLVADLEGLEELENSIERELNAEPIEKQTNETKDELRRSRRGSRKVTSYNENDLIDPILDILDDKKKKKKDEKVPPKKEKLNTEQLFDMLKSSTVEPPQNTFLQSFDSFSSEMNPNESFNSVFNKIIENAEETTKKINKKSVSLTEESSESNIISDEIKTVKNDSNYCDICNKSFIRTDNLLKHKRTITHIQKLSEIEAKEAEEKSKKMQEKQDFPELLESDINIKNILLESERPGINSPIVHSSFTNNDSLKLADIISDVLNKPVLQENDDNKFSSKRYKSLGERKSFDSDNIIIPNPISDVYISKTTILEKQISLLQNMIENQTGVNYIDDISMSSNSSENNKNQKKDDSFLKPTQYEEISEDSINLRNYEEQKLRKTLNRDEELFLECCSLLKSGSEVSSYSNQKVSNNLEVKKYDDELKSAEEKKQEDLYELDEDFSEDNNSRIPTPLGDSYDDEASNSNTISSNWDINKMAPVFVENEPSNSNLTFEKVLGDAIQHEQQEDTDNIDRKSSEEPEQTLIEDTRKIITKGARKVFEGLKVSIPTEELNLEELNLNRTLSETASELKPEKPIRSGRKSKPVKKSQVGSNLLFKMNKKLQVSSFSKEDDKSFDVYDFEETQDNTEVFTKPDYRTFRNKKSSEVESESEDYFDSLVMEPSESTDSSITSLKKPKTHESITKKKCMIMGRIFKNQARSKLEGIDEEMRDIPVIDNEELVENYVANCKKIIKDEIKPKLSETEINQLFDQLLEEKNAEQPNGESTIIKIPPKPKKASEHKKKKLKHRKRVRNNSESTDDEFNINKISKRKNGKSEDNCINLEQELKECIGVASRKSQRKCTSGKQNVLVEYWSSDDSQFEALLETQKIEVKAKETVTEKEKSIIEMPEITEKNLTRKPPRPKKIQQRKKSASERKSLTDTPEVHKKRKSLTENVEGGGDLKKKKTSPDNIPENLDNELILTNRRKRAAVNPLYHWSSSSEDESQDLIEVKPLRDELEDEEDRPIQHGWIVGDSPKKLVTMLAQAKGKKIDVDCVKEQKKRTNANSVS